MQSKHKFNHSLFIFSLVILFFSAAFPLIQAQSAAPGDLDTTFGSGGKVVTGITENEDRPTRVRIQPDGKIVTIGVALESDWGCPANSFLVRHNADGTLDNSFGTNGSVVISFGSEEINFQDFVILPDGNLLVTANKSINCGTRTDLLIYRYTANGALDATFGTNGVITTPLGNETWRQRIVLQPDGKFVVASENFNGISQVAVVRYNPDGTLDATFGTSGITRTSVGSFHTVREILVQTDGKLLVAGGVSYGSRNIFVLRYDPNGTLDNSFGANGIVQTDIDNLPNDVRGMALQPDGKIIVSCGNFSSNYPFSILFLSSSIVRYNASGTLDNTFGANGIVRITEPPNQYPGEIAFVLAIQQNGKFLTAGARNYNFAISRYNSNGTIDTSFGTNGVVITAFENYPGASISSIAPQTDGKILAVGSANFDVALARYLGDSIIAPRTRFDFDGDGKADISVFRPSENNWYILNAAGYSIRNFGEAGDVAAPADYDDDGKTDVAVWRPSNGNWYLLTSGGQFQVFEWGENGDIPIPADHDGDGRADLVLYRPSNSIWYTRFASGGFTSRQFGEAGDKPLLGDFDGDGRADIAVFRPSNNTWYFQNAAGFSSRTFGEAGDIAVPADYDGDGKTDIATFRPSTGYWYWIGSTEGFRIFGQWGVAGDMPVPADFDGDGRTDAAVYRNGVWWILQSTNGTARTVQYGLENDTPVPAAFLP
jgi:uncharacterized delta-60 repeat protein